MVLCIGGTVYMLYMRYYVNVIHVVLCTCGIMYVHESWYHDMCIRCVVLYVRISIVLYIGCKCMYGVVVYTECSCMYCVVL